jgi:hypothetical protein
MAAVATLAERFELAWKRSGLDKAEVERRASGTGKASGHLTHVIEGRRTQLRHDTIAAYARAFGVREEWLAREEGPMVPSDEEARIAADHPIIRGSVPRPQPPPRIVGGGEPFGGGYAVETKPETPADRRIRNQQMVEAMNRRLAREAEEHPYDDDIPERDGDYTWITFARGRLAEAAADQVAYAHARAAIAYAASQLPKFSGGGNSDLADVRWQYKVGLAIARNEDPPDRPAAKLPEPATAPAPPPPEKTPQTPAQKMARLDAEAKAKKAAAKKKR